MPTRRTEGFGDPIGQYNFRVEIDGVAAGHFQVVEGMEGGARATHLTLKRGYLPSDELIGWRNEFLAGRAKRKPAELTQIGTLGRVVARWKLGYALPSGAWNVPLRSTGGAVEQVQIAVEKVERG
jgi:hypothetical protein